jgi:hypothetical protein
LFEYRVHTHGQHLFQPSHINIDFSHAINMAHHAQYLHASLQRFDRVAAQEIIRRFEGAATTVDAEPGPHSLNYDERDHVFLLVCQNRVGSALNEKLGHIIRDYVASEATTLTTFAECNIGDPFDEYEVELEKDGPLQPPGASLDIHLVNFDGINPLGRAKAFHVHELPPTLRCRARNRHMNLANAITFRRVRWDQSSEQHVFDASVGHALQELNTEEEADLATLLDVLAFTDFTAKVKIPKSLEPQPGFKYFEFVDEEPAVRQWLEGTGRTRQVDPRDEPEMSGDARRFASGPSHHFNVLGRVRKPLGLILTESEEPEMIVEPEEVEEQINNSFAALLKSGADGDSDTESSETTTDEASIVENNKPANIVELVGTASDFTIVEHRARPKVQSATDNKTDTVLAPTSSDGKRTRVTIPSGSGAFHLDESFPTYDKSYANVDGVGLCGDAVNQVNWENENVAGLSTRQTNARSQTYEALASSRAASVSMSMSAGRDLHLKPITPMSYADTCLGGSEPWARNVVAPIVSVPTGTLIDADGSIHGDGRSKVPKFPPGLFPPLGSNENQQIRKTNSPNARKTHVGTRECELLDYPRMTQPEDVQQTLTGELMRPDARCEEELLMQFEDDDFHVHERISSQRESMPRLFRTMEQQASKNKHQKKKKKHNAGSTRATPQRPSRLELPSPPPLPRPQREEPGRQRPEVKKAHPIEPAKLFQDRLQQAIGGLLMSVSVKAGMIIQFGLALMTDAGNLVLNKALRCAELQDKLDRLPVQHRHASFLAALVRKNKDAVHLLRLPTLLPGSDSPYDGSSQLAIAWADNGTYGINDKRLYEIEIVAPGGHTWTLEFDQNYPKDVHITLAGPHQQSVYVHYPLRVWDARVRLVSPTDGPEPDSILKRNILAFLDTFDTAMDARGEQRPGFEAMIPNSAFRVASALAKRVLTRRTLASGTWKVTQVWDLHVQAQYQSVMALAKAANIMEQEGRLWWEAALHCDDGKGLGELEELATSMNQIMELLDPVGFEETAAQKVRQERSTRPSEDPYIPFW